MPTPNEQDAAAPRPDRRSWQPAHETSRPSQHPDARSVTARTEGAWQAIVEQLLATPAHDHPDEAQLAPEYAWARKLGVHINRPPKRR